MFDSLTKKEMCYTNIVQATKEYVMNPQSYLSILNLYYRGYYVQYVRSSRTYHPPSSL